MAKDLTIDQFIGLYGGGPEVKRYLRPETKIKVYGSLPFPQDAIRFGLFGAALDEGIVKLTQDEQRVLKEKSHALGEILAEFSDRVLIIDGGCPEIALPTIAGESAKKRNEGVYRIAVSPCSNEDEFKAAGRSTGFYDMVIYTGLPLLQRDDVNAILTDVAIAISGASGTLHEVAGAYDLGRIVGLFEGTGGAADGAKLAFDEIYNVKDTGLVYYVESYPRELVVRGIAEFEVQQKKKRGDLVSMVNVYLHHSSTNRKEVFVNIRHAGRPATDYSRYEQHGIHNMEVNLLDGVDFNLLKKDFVCRVDGELASITPRTHQKEKGFWYSVKLMSLERIFAATKMMRSSNRVIYHRRSEEWAEVLTLSLPLEVRTHFLDLLRQYGYLDRGNVPSAEEVFPLLDLAKLSISAEKKFGGAKRELRVS